MNCSYPLLYVPYVQTFYMPFDKQTQELRLSQEAGSFLVNDGQLFVRDTKITGWREKF